jgi:hypothetical protein
MHFVGEVSELVCSGEKSTLIDKKNYDGNPSWPILLSSKVGPCNATQPDNQHGNSPTSATCTAKNGDPR